MEKDFGYQRTAWLLSNLNSSNAPFDLGWQNTVPYYANPCTNVGLTNGTVPMFAFPQMSHSKACQPTDSRGLFYGSNCFHQAFAPVSNEICTLLGDSNAGSECGQKRFLVFDQTGDQTTLNFSSGIRAPAQYLPSWSPKTLNAFDLNKEEFGTKRATIHPSRPFWKDEENQKDDVLSEMHEDTEELDALLYSDDDSYSCEDDEVTSTGHSPSTMTPYDKRGRSEESGEEVASSVVPSKRQKVFDGGYKVLPSLVDTASSVKTNRCFEYEDDAESCCVGSQNQAMGELGSLTGNKRSRKEKIRETVSILQSILPGGGEGKDAIGVLDEAIHYLRSLKVKAKSLGLGTL